MGVVTRVTSSHLCIAHHSDGWYGWPSWSSKQKWHVDTSVLLLRAPAWGEHAVWCSRGSHCRRFLQGSFVLVPTSLRSRGKSEQSIYPLPSNLSSSSLKAWVFLRPQWMWVCSPSVRLVMVTLLHIAAERSCSLWSQSCSCWSWQFNLPAWCSAGMQISADTQSWQYILLRDLKRSSHMQIKLHKLLVIVLFLKKNTETLLAFKCRNVFSS